MQAVQNAHFRPYLRAEDEDDVNCEVLVSACTATCGTPVSCLMFVMFAIQLRPFVWHYSTIGKD